MKKASIGLVILAWFAPMVSANADELPWWMGERRIIGDNNLEAIEAAVGTSLYDYSSAIARVETRGDVGFCTASRVGDDLFLTNYHCFDYKPCEDIQFRLGYEADIHSTEQNVFGCAEVLSADLSLDYALYRVSITGDDNPTDPVGDTQTHTFDDLAIDIPDDDSSGITKSFSIRQVGTMVAAKIHVKISHSWTGDLVLTLTSPSGTEMLLQDRIGSSADNIDREFLLPAVVGEDPRGFWQLNVSDRASRDTGTLESVTLVITTSSDEKFATEATYPKLAFWVGEIFVNQTMMIAGHPSARLKEIDRSDECKLRTVDTEVVAERTTLTHTCDTEGGSSGSPVIDRDSGRIVALHWGGFTDYNLAIPIKLVVDHMQANIPAFEFAKLTIER